MKAIYEPKGKAREYCELACNLYRGCGHGCTYCYAPAMLRMSKEDFYGSPQPRKGIIEALQKEASKYRGREVLLCFSCDPYQPINKKHQQTRQAIEILHKNGVTANVLTKGYFTDGDLFKKNPHLSKLGVTLTYAEEMEPNAVTSFTREGLLRVAKENGISTWVSYEPVIHPKKVFNSIKKIHGFVDVFKVGKWNYDKRAKAIDWSAFAKEAIATLEEVGARFYIKNDLWREIK